MEHRFDFLVVGSGIAGLMFALKVADRGRVAVITKKHLMDSNTAHAQGGIAAVFDPADTFASHIEDTLASGDGLCNESVVEMVVKSAPERIGELLELGVDFNRSGGKLDLDLCREGGHSFNQIGRAHV